MTRVMRWTLLLCVGCGTAEPAPPATTSAGAELPQAPREAAATVGGDVVATVEGQPITIEEVEEVAHTVGITPLEALRRLEDERVLSRLAAASPVADDPAVERAARRAAVRALLAREIEAGREPEAIPVADVEARHEAIAEMMSAPETRRASHALVALAPDAAQAQLDAAIRLARRIRDGVRASESPSAALDAFSGSQGGLEVSVEHMEPMRRADLVSPFAETLFGAPQPGLIEEPIRTSFGIHVIVLEEIIPPWEVPREEWEPVIRRQLAAERRAEALEQLATRLSEQTNIVVDPAAARLAESVPLSSDARESSRGGP